VQRLPNPRSSPAGSNPYAEGLSSSPKSPTPSHRCVVAALIPTAAWIVVAHGAFALWVASASAEPAPLHVQLIAAACPSPSELEDKLEPLLDRELEVSGSDPKADVVIVDHGVSFTVEIAGVARKFADPTRDCVERARQAAVFIAVNLKPSAAEEQPESEAGDSIHLGLQLLGELAYAGSQQRLAPGPSAGLWLESGSLRFVFSGSVLFASPIELQSAAVAGSVGLTRIPLAVTAGYLLRAGRFAIAPTFGIAADVLRLRSDDLARAKTQLRANLGLIAALDAQLRLSRALSAVTRIGLSAFPRAYALSIDPLGPAGRTPKLWLDASLGVSWQFGD
jgi:hypothetical protein